MPSPIESRISRTPPNQSIVLPDEAVRKDSGLTVNDAALLGMGGASIAGAGYMAQVGLGSGGALILLGNFVGVAPSAGLIAATIGTGIALPVVATAFGVHLIRQAFKEN